MSSDRQRRDSGRRNSRLRRLSDSTAKLLRQIRLVRSDSGYGSDDQRERRDSADAAAAGRDEEASSIRAASVRLDSHDELEEVSSTQTDEEAEAEDGFFEDAAAEEREVRQLSQDERHLISVRFALLREQGRTYRTLWLADCQEEEELQEKHGQEDQERLQQELSLRQKRVDLFKLVRRRKSSSSSYREDSDFFFDSQTARRRIEWEDNEWRRQWLTRTSNWMYGGRYRNALDYWY